MIRRQHIILSKQMTINIPARAFFLCVVLAAMVGWTEQDEKLSAVRPEIFIVGTIHSMHYNPDYHYSITDLLEQIRALEPDVVCGEIAADAFDQVTEGYFPPEAAYLAEMAPVLNYRFVPVDWRLDYATQSKADCAYPESVTDDYYQKILNSRRIQELEQAIQKSS